MSGNAETHVRSLLQKMSADVDVVMNNKTCSERFSKKFNFDSLANRLSLPGGTASVVEVYAHQRMRTMRKTLQSQYTLSPEALKESVTEFILWALVQSHSASLPSVLPKLHHWLPLCYTKQFASRVMTSSRAAIIQQVTFNPDGTVGEYEGVRDTFFAHEKCDAGYYPARTEQFFGRIESAYSALLLGRTDKNAWTEVVSFAFFIVQSARNPNPEGKRFRRDHRAQIISNIFSTIDDYERPYIQFARDCDNLWFSPFFPPRVRVTVSGVTAAVFPMNPNMAMIVTDVEIDDIEAHRIATNNAVSMIRHSVRTGKPLYGVLPD